LHHELETVKLVVVVVVVVVVVIVVVVVVVVAVVAIILFLQQLPVHACAHVCTCVQAQYLKCFQTGKPQARYLRRDTTI